MMQETHTIATMEINQQQLLDMAFNRQWLIATEYRRDKETHEPPVDADGNKVYNPSGTINRIADFIHAEDPYGFDRTLLRIGEEDDAWYFSYYNDGMLYRLMKDGRLRMESADADDMMQNQFDEFRALIDDILAMDLTLRLYRVATAVCVSITKETGTKVTVGKPRKPRNATCVLGIS